MLTKDVEKELIYSIKRYVSENLVTVNEANR